MSCLRLDQGEITGSQCVHFGVCQSKISKGRSVQKEKKTQGLSWRSQQEKEVGTNTNTNLLICVCVRRLLALLVTFCLWFLLCVCSSQPSLALCCCACPVPPAVAFRCLFPILGIVPYNNARGSLFLCNPFSPLPTG